MAKIYVVTKGSYSDYHIVAATLDEEKAEKIKEKFTECDYYGWDAAHIEEYEDSDIILKPMWYVKFDMEGNLIGIDDESDSSYAYNKVEHNKIREFKLKCPRRLTDVCFAIYVSADDEDHALKIARDKLAEYLAEKEGVKC